MKIAGSTISIPRGSGHALEGYLVRPVDAVSFPGVVVIHEAFGLNDHIRCMEAGAGFL
jgi:dienelactone hydrolase